jgi:hypothetical protein
LKAETPFLIERWGFVVLGWLVGVLIWFSYPHISKSDDTGKEVIPYGYKKQPQYMVLQLCQHEPTGILLYLLLIFMSFWTPLNLFLPSQPTFSTAPAKEACHLLKYV